MNGVAVEGLIELRGRIENRLQKAPDVMNQFFQNIRSGFLDKLPNLTNKPHITSTAQCLRVILESEYLKKIWDSISISEARCFFESNEWESSGVPEHNMYVSAQALTITPELGIGRENEKVDKAIEYIVGCLKLLLEKGQREHNYIDCGHGFILYWVINSLTKYRDQLKEIEKEILARTIDYTKNALFYHFTLHSAGDESEFDPVQLAYYLLSSVKFGSYSNNKVIDKTIEIIFSTQKGDGTWKPSHPFLHRPEGGVMNCFSIEVPTAMLKVSRFELLAAKYLPNLQKTLDWIETNFKTKQTYKGWRSDTHWTADFPESWASALVYEFLSELIKIIGQLTNKTLLEDLGGAETIVLKVSWDKIVNYKGFKESIEENIISPIKQNPEGINLETSSILLFGPPGVGKNAIVSALASEIGWPLIVIPPSIFLKEGPDNIVKIAERLFKEFSLLGKTVIFFDEFDEFVTAREIEPNKSGRYVTISMLYWFGKLKENQKVVSIVATNFLEKFDEAVKRPGRFDLVLPIGPPEPEERLELLKREISTFLKESEIRKLASLMDRRMIISEILKLCQFLKNLAKQKKTKEELLRLVENKIKEMNNNLTINLDMMTSFEKNLLLARH